MKEKTLKILSKPKIVIPVFLIIGVFVLYLLYPKVGRAPSVDIFITDDTSSQQSGQLLGLAFLKSGRLEEVLVKEGQEVKKGQILAKLSAKDQEGVLLQAKSNLKLAEAQFASLNSQYANAKKQQDTIVKNYYQTLLSSGLEGIPDEQTSSIISISGTYSCEKEGVYHIKPYKSSDNDSGYSFEFSGLENGVESVKFKNSVSLGSCGLQIKFEESNFDDSVEWDINIPNKKSTTYLSNKNAYDLAKETRDKVLDDLLVNIGKDGGNSVARATVEAALGAYEAALGAYENNFIKAPGDGVISFVDKNLSAGQIIQANKSVINLILK